VGHFRYPGRSAAADLFLFLTLFFFSFFLFSFDFFCLKTFAKPLI
jgi:hypothetical protein